MSAKEEDIVADFRNALIVHGSGEELRDSKAAGFIMMELMHRERPTDGKIRVLDSRRGADVVDFLAQIELGSSAAKLVKVMSILESKAEPFSNMPVQHQFLVTQEGTSTWSIGQLSDLILETAYCSQVDYQIYR